MAAAHLRFLRVLPSRRLLAAAVVACVLASPVASRAQAAGPGGAAPATAAASAADELSAFDNIALADPDRPDARELVAAAAVAAGADAIVDGLALHADTMLSRAYTDGVDLSGGQWQRIALARAMYAAMSGGQVVILDEPTASLDVDAEVALFDQLLTHAAGRTAVVVSHRYSTVRRADRIVVLADGRVTEDGSHDELIARCGRYATLYDLQATKFRDDPDSESDGADPDRSAS